jgi:GT2 family glycosyltransferase
MDVPSADEPRVSIIIVAARAPDRLLRCLEAVARESPVNLAVEVIVVLNAAEPALATALTNAAPGARVVESEVPLGLAGGLNLGARAARGELLHVLHDDTVVGPGWLDALVATADARPEAGAVASVLLHPDGRLQAAGWVLWRDGHTSRPWVGEPPGADALGPAFPVDYCPSAAVLVRRTTWNAIGGADERFHPAYYVDVDLSTAIRHQGQIVLCEPASVVRHDAGGTTSARFRRFAGERNRRQFVEKWAGEPALARARAATVRRATALAAAHAPAVTPASTPAREDPGARAQRERAQLLRDLEVRAQYVVALEAELAEVTARVEAVSSAEREAGTALAHVEAHAAELAGEHHALSERFAVLEADHARAQADLAWLWERECTLVAIQSGGWWRLRARLLPLVRLASSLRALSRRAAPSRRE